MPANIAASLSREEQQCKSFYNCTTTRDSTDRYTVAILFKWNPKDLSGSLAIGEKWFFALARKIQASPQLRIAYDNIVKEYFELNYLSLVKEANYNKYVIPLHGVFHNDQITTTLQTV